MDRTPDARSSSGGVFESPVRPQSGVRTVAQHAASRPRGGRELDLVPASQNPPYGEVGLAERTRQVIGAQLALGRATMQDVTTRLALSERTFRRQLRARGTSFQELLDQVRRELALHYLRGASCSATELSRRLGFNGASAFYRAFRRWTGCSLPEYRAELACEHS